MLHSLISSYQNLGGVQGTPEEMQEYFGKENMPWYRFNDKVLQKAINDLNLARVFSGYELQYRTEKRGRKIINVMLTLEPIEISKTFPVNPAIAATMFGLH
jgi:hypothetical protein